MKESTPPSRLRQPNSDCSILRISVYQKGRLTDFDSLPIPVEKPAEIQTFEYAQEIIALPEEEKTIALKMIREEIKKKSIIQ